MKRIIYILLGMLSVASVSRAQYLDKDQIQIDNVSVTRSDDNRLTIAMDVILKEEMKITSNRAVTLTPILKTATHNKVMPAVVVYGRRRELTNVRNHQLPKDAYTIIRRKDKKEQKISYLVQYTYEAWMQRANLVMDMDLTGCCNTVQEEMTEQLHKLNIEPAVPQLHIAYITPKEEAVKHRAAVGKAYLDFPVNQTSIYPDYRRNSVELAKLRATIDTVRNDKNTSITGLTIEGYASPEGKYASNARLAEGRTKALMQYVRNYYNFDDHLLKMNSIPEDWDGFRKFIEASNLAKKQDVIRIMDNKLLDDDVKEKNIASLMGPEDYRYIVNECYPALRHSDYTVAYTVRGFSLEETREIIKKQPQQLSLQEIFNVAQTYEKGSEEFNHAFQVAVLMFPEDEIANLNAAAMEIQRGGDLTAAKKYLAKANPTAAATLNNLGVIAMKEGRLDQAEAYFKQAEKASGFSEPVNNLQEVQKQRSYPTE